MAKQTPMEGVWFPWILTILQALVFAIGGWTINRISELEAAQFADEKDLDVHEQLLSHPGTEAELKHIRAQLDRMERKLDVLTRTDKEVNNAITGDTDDPGPGLHRLCSERGDAPDDGQPTEGGDPDDHRLGAADPGLRGHQ